MDINNVTFMILGQCINLINFELQNLVVLGDLTTILGGWVVRKIKNKDQLSPAEAEIWAELGNMKHPSIIFNIHPYLI